MLVLQLVDDPGQMLGPQLHAVRAHFPPFRRVSSAAEHTQSRAVVRGACGFRRAIPASLGLPKEFSAAGAGRPGARPFPSLAWKETF